MRYTIEWTYQDGTRHKFATYDRAAAQRFAVVAVASGPGNRVRIYDGHNAIMFDSEQLSLLTPPAAEDGGGAHLYGPDTITDPRLPEIDDDDAPVIGNHCEICEQYESECTCKGAT